MYDGKVLEVTINARIKSSSGIILNFSCRHLHSHVNKMDAGKSSGILASEILPGVATLYLHILPCISFQLPTKILHWILH